MPTLIRRLGITRDDSEDGEEIRARLVATKAALSRSSTASPTRTGRETTRSSACARRTTTASAGSRPGPARSRTTGTRTARSPTSTIVQIVLAAQREALVDLRNEGRISNETMNRVIRDLDLEESRLEI